MAAELNTFSFNLKMKKQIIGINRDINIAAQIVGIRGPLRLLFCSSNPPLKPIAKRRYSENSFGKGAGISRSDLSKTANAPKKKKRIGGLRTFSRMRLVFICLS